ncbi:Interferon-activable protein 203 [Lemmus lemmus]
MHEYKKIVLLKGLEKMNDYEFRIIKSLLRKELHLSERMQKDYDRIQIADEMEDTFPKDAGLNKLIGICQESKDLEHLVKDLKAEKAKVEKQKKEKNKTAVKGKQGESSSPHALSSSNAHSSEEKQTTKTESGKKRKLTHEQTQLPEPSENNTQKDEGCLQTPQKPPPTPSSSSSNKKPKNTNTKNQSTLKTNVSWKKYELLGFSETSNSSAAWECQTLQELVATASSSRHTPQTPPETCDSLKTSQGSPAPSCQSLLLSPESDSSSHRNSREVLTLSNGVPTLYVPKATASNKVSVPSVPSETVSKSLSAPQMSRGSVPISAQTLHLPTTAAFNSMQTPHHPQAVASRSAQTPRASATLKSIKTPPVTGSSSVQEPHTLPGAMFRNAYTTQVPQRTTGSSIQTLNPTKVNAPRNAQVPETAFSSLQDPKVLPLTTSNSLPVPRVPRPTATSRVQPTQMHPGAASSFIPASHASPPTMVRSVCTTQEPQRVASSTRQALSCPEVKKASRCALPPQIPSATASSNLLASRVLPATAPSSLQTAMVTQVTRSSNASKVINDRRKVTQS